MDVAHFILDGNADAVEFCPHESFNNVLATSNCVLQEGDQRSQLSCITLFDVDVDYGQLELTQKAETADVFNIKWSGGCSNNLDSPLLAQADANGDIRVYRLHVTNFEWFRKTWDNLNEVCGKRISSSTSLSVYWNSSATSMAVGISNGSFSIVSLNKFEMNVEQEWKAHDFELWVSSFDNHQPMLVYTGSYDCKIIYWDLRDDPSKMVFRNTKAHKMGICCISKSHVEPNTLLTGSYDESLRIWGVRSTCMLVYESSISLGRGVRRIKHHTSILGLVLTAYMHNAFVIVKCDGEEPGLLKCLSTMIHFHMEQIGKEGDVFASGRRKNPVIATCSFYDELLHVWVPEADLFV